MREGYQYNSKLIKLDGDDDAFFALLKPPRHTHSHRSAQLLIMTALAAYKASKLHHHDQTIASPMTLYSSLTVQQLFSWINSTTKTQNEIR